jgi:hypothetical protein
MSRQANFESLLRDLYLGKAPKCYPNFETLKVPWKGLPY